MKSPAHTGNATSVGNMSSVGKMSNPAPKPLLSSGAEAYDLLTDGFNLADDPWIPFVGHGELSLRDVFRDAHRLPGWPSGEPLFGAAVMRLLTALTYRVAGVCDSSTLESARAAEQFDPDAADAYFNEWHERFWLHPPADSDHTPFYQDPGLADLPPMPIARSRLAMDVLPSYVWGQQVPDPEFTPAAAARALLVFLLYGPGGSGRSHPDLPRSKWQDGRLRGKVSIHPTGECLHGTLILHLIDPDDMTDELPGGIGIPSWEAPPKPADTPLTQPTTILSSLPAAGRRQCC